MRAATGVLSQLRLDLVTARLTGRPAASDGAESAEIATAAVDGRRRARRAVRPLPAPARARRARPRRGAHPRRALDPISAGLMILTLPLIPVFFWLIGRATANRARERWQAMSLLSDALPRRRARAADAAGVQPRRCPGGAIEQVSDEYRSATMGTLRLAFLSGTVLELAATLGVALVAVTVGVRLVDGGIAFEPALTVLVLAPELYLPLRNLAAGFHASADGAAVADRLLTLIEQPAGAPGATHRRRARARRRSRSSRSRSPTRAGRAGARPTSTSSSSRARRVALVGPSGGGKSTLASLLCLFAAPQSGRILIGDDDLADCDAAAWRRQIAWVPQSPTLFRGRSPTTSGSADPTATDERVRAAAVEAGADAFVSRLPGGYANARRRGRPAAVDGRGAAHRPRPRLPPRRAARRARRADSEPRPRERPRSWRLPSSGCGPGRTMLLIAHDAELASQADRVVTTRRRPDRGGAGMTATLGRCSCAGRDAAEARGALDRARRADGAPRRRADRDLRLPDLARGRAAAGALARGHDRRRPLLRPLAPARPLPRPPRLARPRAALARPDPRAVLRARSSRSRRRSSRDSASGDLVSRMVGDVDALQGLYLRGIGPPAAAIVVASSWSSRPRVILPVAGLVLGVGLLVAGRRRAAARRLRSARSTGRAAGARAAAS